jgi:hypothetical protein
MEQRARVNLKDLFVGPLYNFLDMRGIGVTIVVCFTIVPAIPRGYWAHSNYQLQGQMGRL